MEKMDDFKGFIVSEIGRSKNPKRFLETIKADIKNVAFKARGNFLKNYYEEQLKVVEGFECPK